MRNGQQAANGLFSSFAKLRGSSGNEDFFSFDESPLHSRPKQPKASEKGQKGRTDEAADGPGGDGFGFPSMMDSKPDIWSLFNGEWGNKIEGERRKRRR